MLLQGFYPRLVDPAEPEESHFGGPKPEVVEDVEWNELLPIIQSDNFNTGFGANIGILVRNDEARQSLHKEVPAMKQALVLTILEAKGLEFNTVVILNFWKDSLVGKEWLQRLLYHLIINALKTQEKNALPDMYQTLRQALLEGQKNNKQRERARRKLAGYNSNAKGSEFDLLNFEEKYSMLADELKHLYVAVTRSRHRVVMFDEDIETRKPFYLLCQLTGVTRPSSMMDTKPSTRNQYKKVSASAQEYDHVAEEKRKKEWETQGKALLTSHFYERAAFCFRNAGNVKACRSATAYHLVEQADEATNVQTRSSALYDAGLLFLMSENNEHLRAAKECFRKAGYATEANHPYFRTLRTLDRKINLPASVPEGKSEERKKKTKKKKKFAVLNMEEY